MIAACSIAVFLITFFLGKPTAMAAAFIIDCFIPDELPFVNEVIEIALILKIMCKKRSDLEEGKQARMATSKMSGFDKSHSR